MRRSWPIAAACLTAAATPAFAECEDITYIDTSYTVCEVAAGEDLRLWLNDDAGQLLGGFHAVESQLGEGRLSFAMNAGMFHADRMPVGLYIEKGETVTGLSNGGGYGNFGLLPNGVFCIAETLRVYETEAFRATGPACTYATQSGPMLVIGGELHPRFLVNSESAYIRNGVGTTADGSRAVFAISNSPVTFHQFGSLFRDHLKLPDALYFDGKVSRLYAPGLGRADRGFPLGPIVGTVD